MALTVTKVWEAKLVNRSGPGVALIELDIKGDGSTTFLSTSEITTGKILMAQGGRYGTDAAVSTRGGISFNVSETGDAAHFVQWSTIHQSFNDYPIPNNDTAFNCTVLAREL